MLTRSFWSKSRIVALITFMAATACSCPARVFAAERDRPNGFVLSHLRIPRDEIKAGGPASDAIRSVDAPRFKLVADTNSVQGSTPVIGVAIGELARAYPIYIMEWHQIANDDLEGRPVLVTYDPLTDMACAWRVSSPGKPDRFGVSGLLDRMGFLIFDRRTSSLWSPITGQAISGSRAGERLAPLRVRVETLARWQQRHPSTLVLELPERPDIDYRRSPYTAYWVSEDVPLAVRARDDRFHPKEMVLGVEHDGRSRAYIASILLQVGSRIVDDFSSRRLRIEYQSASGTFSYEAPEDVRVRSSYWFAWKSLHPDTEIWREDLVRDGSDEAEPSDASGSGAASSDRARGDVP